MLAFAFKTKQLVPTRLLPSLRLKQPAFGSQDAPPKDDITTPAAYGHFSLRAEQEPLGLAAESDNIRHDPVSCIVQHLGCSPVLGGAMPPSGRMLWQSRRYIIPWTAQISREKEDASCWFSTHLLGLLSLHTSIHSFLYGHLHCVKLGSSLFRPLLAFHSL